MAFHKGIDGDESKPEAFRGQFSRERRAPGYYWIKIDDEWEIAEWWCKGKMVSTGLKAYAWLRTGRFKYSYDEDFEKIDEIKLTHK